MTSTWISRILGLAVAALLFSACPARADRPPDPAQVQARARKLGDAARSLWLGWRWADGARVAAALERSADRERAWLGLAAPRPPVADLEIVSVQVLGDELDRGVVEVRLVLTESDTQRVVEQRVRQEWYRVGLRWYLQPQPGIPPFDTE